MTRAEIQMRVDRQEHAERVAGIDWHAYRKCPTCLRPMGAACVSLSGLVVAGRPDGVEVQLEHAHVARRRRRGR